MSDYQFIKSSNNNDLESNNDLDNFESSNNDDLESNNDLEFYKQKCNLLQKRLYKYENKKKCDDEEKDCIYHLSYNTVSVCFTCHKCGREIHKY